MAVAYDASSESHAGATGSTSEASFSWAHVPVSSSPSGVLVYTFTNANADDATAVTYGGTSLTAVASGRAVDTAGEPGDCKAWLLSGPTTTPVPTGTWSASSSPGFGTGAINGIAYGNGYWVAVGASGSVRYATEPTGTWTAASSPGFGTSAVNSVAHDSVSGTWVAVGAGGSVRYTTDPTGTWTAASSPGFGTENVTSVTVSKKPSANIWVAVSASGSIRYATDPTGTWASASPSGFAGYALNDVSQGMITSTSARFVAVAQGIMWTQLSGAMALSWEINDSSGFTSGKINGTAYGNGYWVGVADTGEVRATNSTSIAGTWTAASSAGFGTENVLSVAYGNGYFVATGASGSIRYATNPTGTWSAASSSNFGTSAINDVVYGNMGWVAVGASGKIGCASVTITVTRTNNANEIYAVGITVTSDFPVLAATGVSTASGDAALSEVSVNDGSNGTASLRFAGVNSGLAGIVDNPASPGSNNLSRGTNSTWVRDIDFGTRVAGVVRETTAGGGSRSVGFSSTTSDDVAAVYLAIQEQVVPWTVGIPIR